MAKTWTVEEVMELFTVTVTDTFAVSEKGQAHLNRIAKAITNESLDKRVGTMRETNAQKAFDKKYREVSAATPEKLQDLVDRKETWMATWIERKYSTDEI
jgi:DNA-binding PadR family transcriptional regulator